ncbi:MAG: hypothetical protein HYW24_05275 [Candidatus Aenigmarchaeota archaeon]|nr:hypothetical protein [Candidatus Aenigmarchaeota archaeon]
MELLKIIGWLFLVFGILAIQLPLISSITGFVSATFNIHLLPNFRVSSSTVIFVIGAVSAVAGLLMLVFRPSEEKL